MMNDTRFRSREGLHSSSLSPIIRLRNIINRVCVSIGCCRLSHHNWWVSRQSASIHKGAMKVSRRAMVTSRPRFSIDSGRWVLGSSFAVIIKTTCSFMHNVAWCLLLCRMLEDRVQRGRWKKDTVQADKCSLASCLPEHLSLWHHHHIPQSNFKMQRENKSDDLLGGCMLSYTL